MQQLFFVSFLVFLVFLRCCTVDDGSDMMSVTSNVLFRGGFLGGWHSRDQVYSRNLVIRPDYANDHCINCPSGAFYRGWQHNESALDNDCITGGATVSAAGGCDLSDLAATTVSTRNNRYYTLTDQAPSAITCGSKGFGLREWQALFASKRLPGGEAGSTVHPMPSVDKILAMARGRLDLPSAASLLKSDDDAPTWWVADSATNVMEFFQPPTEAQTPPEMSMTAMIGETEHRQLVGRLQANSSLSPLNSVTISFRNGSVMSPIPASWLSWRQQGYVRCTAGGVHQMNGWGAGWYPDPLMDPPSGGVTLSPNTTVSLWVTVAVPPTASAGVYSAVGVVSAAGERTLLQFNISVTVLNIRLPSIAESGFGTAFEFDQRAALVSNTTGPRAYWDFTCEHRMAPDELYIFGSNPPPKPRAHADYTYMATECGGPGGARWMNIGEIDYVLWSRRPNFTASMIEEKLAWMAPTVQWLEQQGFLQKSYVYGFDEAGPEYALAIRQLFGAVKARWPALRTMAVLNWNGSTDHLVEEVGSVVDVWVEDYRTYNESLVSAWMASSAHEYWTYWCCCYKLELCLNNFV